MQLIKCRFLDENKAPKGREYTYATNDDVAVGETVSTAEGKEIIVAEIDVPQEAIAGFENKLKYVTKITPGLDEIAISADEIIDAEAVETEAKDLEVTLPEISINKENLAIVEQLPIITEQLKVFSLEIDNIISVVELMECTEKNRQTVKKHRQKINALLSEFEKRRIAIKNEIQAPYDKFNDDYKTCVSDKISKALKILDGRIIIIENDIKQKLSDDVEGYFYEYLASKNIDWLTWEQSGIKVGLSDNKTALRREAKDFIDKVSDALILIETQEHKDEIMVEYKKELNVAKAISTVQARVKAVAEQERIRAEADARRKQQEEQRRLQAEALEKARMDQVAAHLTAPITETHMWRPAEQTPTISAVPPESPATAPEVKKYSLAFKINNETPERLAIVKKFLKDNGFEYVQVPLKNIIREV